MNDQLKSILEQQLRDVHTPDAVSWWPLAPGWWAVIALLLVALVFALVKLSRHRQQNAYRKAAIQALETHFVHWQTQKKNERYLQAANLILKRACSHLSLNSVSAAAGLSGTPWVEYLNTYAKTDLSHTTEIALTEGLYQESPNCDIAHVHHEVKTWLAQHNAIGKPQSSKTEGFQHA